MPSFQRAIVVSVLATVLVMSITDVQGQLVGTVRLRNGPNSYSGILEVFFGNKWGRVCSRGWTATNTEVICQQLGFQSGQSHFSSGPSLLTAFRASEDIVLNDVACNGQENGLLSCTSTTNDLDDCSPENVIGVVCNQFSEGDVRLGSGDILEIWLNNSWTAVCSSVNLTQQTLDTACQSAGYTSGTSGNAVSISMATNQVLTGGLSCDATSKFLADCIEDDTVYGNRESCSTQQVVTVNCVGTEGSLRLSGGPSPNIGQVEVFTDGAWEPVCSSAWGGSAGEVSCAQLGFTSVSSQLSTNNLTLIGPNLINPLALSSIVCSGSESDISDCTITEAQVTCAAGDRVVLVCGGSFVLPTIVSMETEITGIQVSWQFDTPISARFEYFSDFELAFGFTLGMRNYDRTVSGKEVARRGSLVTGLFSPPFGEFIEPFVEYSGSISYNVQGASSPSVMLTKFKIEDVLTTSAINSTSLTVSWMSPTGLVSISNYHLFLHSIRPPGIAIRRTDSFLGSQLSVDLHNLEENATYQIQVLATTNGINSPRFATEIALPSDVPTGIPTKFIIVDGSIKDSTVQISWEPPRFIEQNGDLTHYIITFSSPQDNEQSTTLEISELQRVSGSDTTYLYELEDLKADSQYTINVAARNSNGTGPSATLQLKTKPSKLVSGQSDEASLLPVVIGSVIAGIVLLILIAVAVIALFMWQKKFKGSYNTNDDLWVSTPTNTLPGQNQPSNDGQETPVPLGRELMSPGERPQTPPRTEDREKPLNPQDGRYFTSRQSNGATGTTGSHYDSLQPLSSHPDFSAQQTSWNPYAAPLIHQVGEDGKTASDETGVEKGNSSHLYEDPYVVDSKKRSKSMPTPKMGPSDYVLPSPDRPSESPYYQFGETPQYANTLDANRLKSVANEQEKSALQYSNISMSSSLNNGYDTPKKFPTHYNSTSGSSNLQSFNYEIMSPKSTGHTSPFIYESQPIPLEGATSKKQE